MELTALMISPNRELASLFQKTVTGTGTFQIMADLKNYPALPTLEIRLRQIKPDVVLLDVATDADVAGEVIRFLTGWKPLTLVVALHTSKDSQAILRTLRLGASEFLHAPFDAANQREAVTRILRLKQPEPTEAPELGKVIIFTSAKPGAGASTLATHTAFAIRKATGKRVLLVDLDLAGGTIGFYLKLQGSQSMVNALESAEQIDTAAWATMTVNSSGVDILLAPETVFAACVDATRLHDVLEYARMLYDWVLLDTPAIFHRTTLLAVSESDQVSLVTTSDLASLHLARKAVNLLGQLGLSRDRFQLVVNRLNKNDGFGSSELEKIFNCTVQASLPNDYFALHRVISLGQPLGTDCELGRAIAGLAAKLSGVAPMDKKRAGGWMDPKPALSQT